MSKRTVSPARSADVARLAGVSRSAVSRTFTEGAYVSAETRQKVIDAARMLNYSPNAIARGLSKRKTGLVGIIAADLYNPVNARQLEMLSLALQHRGYGILLLVPDTSDFDEFIPRLLSYQVDAIVTMLSTIDTKLPLAAERTGRPVVMMSQTISPNLLNSVTSDNYGAGVAVGKLLQARGYSRIAFLSGRADTVDNNERRQGLRDELSKHGMKIFAEEPGLFRRDAAAAATRRLLERSPRPDAIFCANDVMALVAADVALTEFKLSVPDELAIVGYDNSEAAALATPRLTSVGPDMDEMVRLIADMVVKKINSDDGSVEHIVLPVHLVERESTHPARDVET